ncbi:MAG: DeoR/GlpR transcriptional regulator [Candidatus Omnitrophica bacterium]|nr:DeoR/GlpR transcriptional regulator [Candidatus Omnitrophota bacterium]
MGYAEANRQAAILNFLRQEKKASVADLSQMFEASEATIRRDLTKLENKGHLVKTYGGALLSTSTQFEFSYNERLLKNVREKKRIGALAARMVKSGLSIFLDSGTTALQIAMNLKHLQEPDSHHQCSPDCPGTGSQCGNPPVSARGCYRPKSQGSGRADSGEESGAVFCGYRFPVGGWFSCPAWAERQ